MSATDRHSDAYLKLIFLAQIASITMMWMFLVSVVLWILHLVNVARELHDALTASIGLSLIVLPAYSLVAAILTFVFFGLRRGARSENDEPGESEGERHDS